MSIAMILAAGRGERLKPITDEIPKPLCEVGGRPLIEHHVINLAKAGFHTLVINHAYLGGKIRQHLGRGGRYGVDIIYSPEPPGGLETGGGIVKALPFLGASPFVTVNADIYTDFDFSLLKPDAIGCLHLVMVENNPEIDLYGDFGINKAGLVSNEERQYTFAGIACYHPQLFINYPQGRYSVTPMLRKLVDEAKVTGQIHKGCWCDIGSIERLERARNNLS